MVETGLTALLEQRALKAYTPLCIEAVARSLDEGFSCYSLEKS
jgi:hypothetical protein